jgi:hypothetical protein
VLRVFLIDKNLRRQPEETKLNPMLVELRVEPGRSDVRTAAEQGIAEPSTHTKRRTGRLERVAKGLAHQRRPRQRNERERSARERMVMERRRGEREVRGARGWRALGAREWAGDWRRRFGRRGKALVEAETGGRWADGRRTLASDETGRGSDTSESDRRNGRATSARAKGPREVHSGLQWAAGAGPRRVAGPERAGADVRRPAGQRSRT